MRRDCQRLTACCACSSSIRHHIVIQVIHHHSDPLSAITKHDLTGVQKVPPSFGLRAHVQEVHHVHHDLHGANARITAAVC